MKSLHINSNNEQLYTVIHSPSENTKIARKHAVVICSPITHEHDASYLATKQLALRLSKLGFDVARFDYFSTGNSSGLSQQLSLQACVRNIADVGQFLVGSSGSEKLSYIGLRLGAVLAAMSSINHPPDQLILWDPVISGKNILPQLVDMQKKFLDKHKRTEFHQHNLGKEYLGYPYSNDLLVELNKVQLDDIDIPNKTLLAILASESNIEHSKFIEKTQNTRSHLQHEIATNAPVDWQDIDIMESSFFPGPSINQICNFLKTNQ